MLNIKGMNPGDKLQPGTWNELLAEVERLGRFTVEPPLELVNQDQGMGLRLNQSGFWAQLVTCSSSSSSVSKSSTSSSATTYIPCIGYPYCFQEVQPTGIGTWQQVSNGRTGTAYEVNGNCINSGTVVWLLPGLSGEYLFTQCCSVVSCGVCNLPSVLQCSTYVDAGCSCASGASFSLTYNPTYIGPGSTYPGAFTGSGELGSCGWTVSVVLYCNGDGSYLLTNTFNPSTGCTGSASSTTYPNSQTCDPLYISFVQFVHDNECGCTGLSHIGYIITT